MNSHSLFRSKVGFVSPCKICGSRCANRVSTHLTWKNHGTHESFFIHCQNTTHLFGVWTSEYCSRFTEFLGKDSPYNLELYLCINSGSGKRKGIFVSVAVMWWVSNSFMNVQCIHSRMFEKGSWHDSSPIRLTGIWHRNMGLLSGFYEKETHPPHRICTKASPAERVKSARATGKSVRGKDSPYNLELYLCINSGSGKRKGIFVRVLDLRRSSVAVMWWVSNSFMNSQSSVAHWRWVTLKAWRMTLIARATKRIGMGKTACTCSSRHVHPKTCWNQTGPTDGKANSANTLTKTTAVVEPLES